MLIKAFAKINWTLDITGTRSDGYHLLDMVMQKITLCDELVFSFSSGFGASLQVEGNPVLASEGGNIILKAAELLSGGRELPGVLIKCIKHIPTGAGLGGGSADAAATLLSLNDLWKLGYSREQLSDLALKLGADVPFFLNAASASVTGIGENILPFRCKKSYPLVIVKPRASLSTAAVYHQWDLLEAPLHPASGPVLQALETGDTGLLSGSGGNTLRSAAVSFIPEIEDIIGMLKKSGAFYAEMTGSGSAVFGVYSDDFQADQACRDLRCVCPVCLRADTIQEVAQ